MDDFRSVPRRAFAAAPMLLIKGSCCLCTKIAHVATFSTTKMARNTVTDGRSLQVALLLLLPPVSVAGPYGRRDVIQPDQTTSTAHPCPSTRERYSTKLQLAFRYSETRAHNNSHQRGRRPTSLIHQFKARADRGRSCSLSHGAHFRELSCVCGLVSDTLIALATSWVG